MIFPFLLALQLGSSVLAGTVPLPAVTFDNNDTIFGTVRKGIESFKGIPFAEPPIGALRFKHPIPFKGSLDGFEAFDYGDSCISFSPFKAFDGLGLIAKVLSKIPGFPIAKSYLFDVPKIGVMSEDCLSINVWRPAGTKLGDNLPILLWIHGGAFQFGGPAIFPGDPYIKASVKMGQPTIFVSIAYRLGPYGFLGGKAILDEGSANAGLLDQRLAMEWVAENIHSFGGNPDNVTVFGESAGAMSIGYQMVSNGGDISHNGKNLFHAAIFQSGDVQTGTDVDSDIPQDLSRRLMEWVGCGNGTEVERLECLRYTPTENIRSAIDEYSTNLPEFLHILDQFTGFGPRVDGTFIPEFPFDAIRKGKVASLPFITGNQEDEGTIFTPTFGQVWKSRAEVDKKVSSIFKYDKPELVQAYLDLYPSDPSEGAPYRTGDMYAIASESKRVASILTDALFHIPRRLHLAHTPKEVPTYVFMADPLHHVPVVGSFHSNDLVWQFWGKGTPSDAYRNYFISFANHHDPNVGTGLPEWPRFDNEQRKTLRIGLTTLEEGVDVFPQEGREEAITLGMSTNLLMD